MGIGTPVTKKGQNVTKYDAGGSGDNYIPDGYIKSVEKIWLDNYTLTGNVVGTCTSIALAKLPKNKKITSIDVMIETAASQTLGSLSIGFTTDASIDTLCGLFIVTHNETLTTIRLPMLSSLDGVVDYDGNFAGKMQAFQKVTSGTQTTIALFLDTWTMTTGSVKSIVRYV